MNEGCGYKRKGAEGIATNQNISDYATGVLMFSISTWHRCVFCVRGGSKGGNPVMAPIQFCHGIWPLPPAKGTKFLVLIFQISVIILLRK